MYGYNSGSFVNCVKAAKGSAKALLSLIVTEFPCFRDEAVFQGSQGEVTLNINFDCNGPVWLPLTYYSL